jgi:hypothetical protein
MAPARDPETDEHPSHPPLSQRQEDMLIELFLELDVDDRKKVIKLCRDRRRAARKNE